MQQTLGKHISVMMLEDMNAHLSCKRTEWTLKASLTDYFTLTFIHMFEGVSCLLCNEFTSTWPFGLIFRLDHF